MDFGEASVVANRAYSEEFLISLGRKFKFDARRPDLAEDLRDMAMRYLVARHNEDNSEYIRKSRKQFQALALHTHKFILELSDWEDRDLAGDMARAARINREPRPATNFPELSEHQRNRGNAYYKELMRLLNLLEATAQMRHKPLTGHRASRKQNDPLVWFVAKIEDFWVQIPGNRFTVDYHRGSGITDAFRFVRELVKPIDTISDKHIVTVMRTVIAARRPPPKTKVRGRLKRSI
jgi:hypothetical protein